MEHLVFYERFVKQPKCHSMNITVYLEIYFIFYSRKYYKFYSLHNTQTNYLFIYCLFVGHLHQNQKTYGKFIMKLSIMAIRKTVNNITMSVTLVS